MLLKDALSKQTEVHRALLSELGEESYAADVDYEFTSWPDPSRRLMVGVAPIADAKGYRIAIRIQRGDGAAARAAEKVSGKFNLRIEKPLIIESVNSLASARSLKDSNATRMLAKWRRPLCPGLSIGTRLTLGGALGGFFFRKAYNEENVGVLTSSTTLAGGRMFTAEIGDYVYQPSKTEGPLKRSYAVGRISDFTDLSPKGSNEIDAGFAALEPNIDFTPSLPDIRNFPYRRKSVSRILKEDELLDMPASINLFKIGPATGYTTGRLSAVAVSGVPVSISSRLYRFNNVIEITGNLNRDFAKPGDSGAIVYSSDPLAAIGILFAFGAIERSSRKKQNVYYACPIAPVLRSLDLHWIS